MPVKKKMFIYTSLQRSCNLRKFAVYHINLCIYEASTISCKIILVYHKYYSVLMSFNLRKTVTFCFRAFKYKIMKYSVSFLLYEQLPNQVNNLNKSLKRLIILYLTDLQNETPIIFYRVCVRPSILFFNICGCIKWLLLSSCNFKIPFILLFQIVFLHYHHLSSSYK